jgi:hypothetical protein
LGRGGGTSVYGSQAKNTNIAAGGREVTMTNGELQEAIKDANNDIDSLSLPPPKGPFPQYEVKRREMILLRQITLYNIEDAKEENNEILERFNTEIYELMMAFAKAE